MLYLDEIDGIPILKPSTLHALATRYTQFFGGYEDAWQECVLLCVEIADEAPVVPVTTPPHVWLRWEVMSRLRLRAKHWRSQGIAETGAGTARKRWVSNPLQPTKPLGPALAAQCHDLLQHIYDRRWAQFTDADRDILRFLLHEYDTLTPGWYMRYGQDRNLRYDAVKRRIAMMRKRLRCMT